MHIGADTGLFLLAAQGQVRAEALWKEVVSGDHTLVASVVSVHEVLHHFFRIAKPESGLTWLHLLQAFPNIQLESVTLDIAEKSAGYRHGLGLSTVDSLILATFIQSGCELMVTSDSDFEMVARQKVIPVEILR